MKRIRGIIYGMVLTATAASTCLSASSASAAEPAGVYEGVVKTANPAATYAGLSASERKTFDKWVTPVRVETSTVVKTVSSKKVSASARRSSCKEVSHSYTARGIFGNRLYAHGQTTRVCRRVGAHINKVTSVKVSSIWRKTYWLGWDYVNGHSETKNASWDGRGMIQSHFRFELAKIPAQNVYDCLQVRISAGSWGVRKSNGCSLS